MANYKVNFKKMIKDYKTIVPPRFQNVSYDDVPEEIKIAFVEQMQKKNGLFLYGDTGVGKTHIVCALIKNILEEGFDVMFLNTSKFLEQLRQEFNKDSDEESLFKQVLDFKGILILDDIGAEKVSEWVVERLYIILNERYESMIPVIFTSNLDFEILSARLGARIVSRIAGMTYKIKMGGQDKRLIN